MKVENSLVHAVLKRKKENFVHGVLFKADLKWLNDLDVITLEDKFF